MSILNSNQNYGEMTVESNSAAEREKYLGTR